MKKFAVLVLIAVMMVGFTQVSRAQGFKEGGIDLNLGLGVTSGLGFVPVYFGGNYMIKDFLSVGAEMQFRIDQWQLRLLWNDDKYSSSGFRFYNTWLIIISTACLKLPEEFDVYAGIDFGYAIYGDYKHKDDDYTWKPR